MVWRVIHLEFEIVLCQYGVYDEWNWLSLVLKISVLLIIAGRMGIAHSIRLLRKRQLSSHRKPEVRYPLCRARSQL